MDYSDNTGWQSLFDGKTMNGWSGLPAWYVKDAAIYVGPNVDYWHSIHGRWDHIPDLERCHAQRLRTQV